MHKIDRPRALICLYLFLVGCSSQGLTRAKAKDILENSDLYKMKPQRVSITPEEVNRLTKNGYLRWQGIGILSLTTTPKGRQYFDSAAGEMTMFGTPGMVSYSVVTKKPMKPEVVEITGITGDDNSTARTVEYRWRWLSDAQPQELKAMLPSLAAINEQAVTMRLYDDGWRPQWSR